MGGEMKIARHKFINSSISHYVIHGGIKTRKAPRKSHAHSSAYNKVVSSPTTRSEAHETVIIIVIISDAASSYSSSSLCQYRSPRNGNIFAKNSTMFTLFLCSLLTRSLCSAFDTALTHTHTHTLGGFVGSDTITVIKRFFFAFIKYDCRAKARSFIQSLFTRFFLIVIMKLQPHVSFLLWRSSHVSHVCAMKCTHNNR